MHPYLLNKFTPHLELYILCMESSTESSLIVKVWSSFNTFKGKFATLDLKKKKQY